MNTQKKLTKKQQTQILHRKLARKTKYHTTPEEWFVLTFGLKDQDVADLLGIDQSTANRWKSGKARIPFMAAELMRLQSGVLPLVYGDFAGMKCNGKKLWHPDYHYDDGVTAKDVRSWWIVRQVIFEKKDKLEQFQQLIK